MAQTAIDQVKSPNYLKQDVALIFQAIKAGESCAIIGTGSVGKSNLMRFITRPDIRLQHLEKGEAKYCLMVMLNPHMMVNLGNEALAHAGESWPGYELMLNRLYRAMWDGDYPEFVVERDVDREKSRKTMLGEAHHLYNRLYRDNPVLAQAGIRHLESLVYEVLSLGPMWKVVFIFDEIEEFINALPATFFQSLRGLRDAHKQRVMFITASRRTLTDIVEDAIEDRADAPQYKSRLEGFVELFNEWTLYISLMDYPSVMDAVDRYIIRHRMERLNSDLELKDNITRALFKVSGGHGGLLRRSFLPVAAKRKTLGDARDDAFPSDDLLDELLRNAGVATECQTIYFSLPRAEQETLCDIVNKQYVANQLALQNLVDKHLVVDNVNRPYVKLPLLHRYVYRLMPPNDAGQNATGPSK
jgi:hypothetical protein